MIREAVQMALEALEDANYVARMEFSDENYYSEAINALRQALVDADDTSQKCVDEKAKREQKPVAWLKTWSDGSLSVLKTKSPSFADHELEPLYTAPPKREWVGLTEEEVGTLTVFDGLHHVETPLLADFIRAIEAKLKEKNT